MNYTVTANRHAVVDGLGVFEEGDVRSFTQADVDSYTSVTGLKLNQGNLPDGLELTVKTGDGE